MCTTDPGTTLLFGLVLVVVAGGLPLALAWRAARDGSRGMRLWTAGVAAMLAGLTIAMRPSGHAPTYGPVRQALMDAVAYGLTWVFVLIALLWALAAWRDARWTARAALTASAIPVLVLGAWWGYSVLGPDICSEIMPIPVDG